MSNPGNQPTDPPARKWGGVAVAVLIAAAVVFAMWILPRLGAEEGVAESGSGGVGLAPSAGPDAGGERPGTAPGIPPIPDDAFTVTVRSVWDGDTLRAIVDEPSDLADGGEEVRVRLIGIDSPERANDRTPADECWSLDARDALLDLAPEGSTVWAATDVEPFDNYDRLLLYLWTEDGVFINLEMIAGGSAEAIRVRPNDAHIDLLRDAEAAAVASGAGMWGACGL